MKKKLLSILLCLIISALTSVSVMAGTDSNTVEILLNRGLSNTNIQTLYHLSFTTEEILAMTNADYQKILKENFGKTFSVTPFVSTVVVTGIPDEIYSSTSTFLSGCGLVAGGFYTHNPGATYTQNIAKFSNYVFNNATAKKFYFLFGEYDSGIGYHKGVDMQAANGTNIRSAHTGSVKFRTDYGGVLIFDGSYTHAYLHMSGLTSASTVTKGTIIGKQSNVSTQTIGSHLHYEVRAGDSLALGDSTANNMNTAPYYQMVKNL
ncbi:MAG: M23 family metallopeptidase [Flavobacterium sp.]